MSVRASMFVHLLKRGLLGRGNRPLIAFVALTVASTMITAMLNLNYGLERKLSHDFRSYGANVTVAAPEGEGLPPNAEANARSLLGSEALVVPFAFAVAHTSSGDAVIVAGTDIASVQRLNAWWLVSKWPGENEALIGSKAAAYLHSSEKGFDLAFSGRLLHLKQSGTLKTGADEENRIYVPLDTFEAWTNLGPSLLEISVSGSQDRVNSALAQLQSAFPGAQVRPVRQLLEAEGAVIRRMRSVMLASTLLIALTVALCVLSTLTSSVLERRRDFAVMKAIGSSQKSINALFAGEAMVIATVAGIAGYAIGSGLAAWIAQINFHAPVAPEVRVLPMVVAASVSLALLAALVPLARLQRIEPAGILKGE
jgi:putative ABC transport system permease protein